MKKKKKEKNMDRTQTKLNTPDVRYEAKILPPIINNSRQMSEENFEKNVLGEVSKFSTDKSFKT